jgi:hypothetical protein
MLLEKLQIEVKSTCRSLVRSYPRNELLAAVSRLGLPRKVQLPGCFLVLQHHFFKISFSLCLAGDPPQKKTVDARDMNICRPKDHKRWARPSFCGQSQTMTQVVPSIQPNLISSKSLAVSVWSRMIAYRYPVRLLRHVTGSFREVGSKADNR